jgi:hypothetical protein
VSSVAWTDEVLERLMASALLGYLAVAHYGRGRGDWAPSEYPAHWQELVAEVLSQYGEGMRSVWSHRGQSDGAAEIEQALREILAQAARAILERLYPGAEGRLAPSGPSLE